nr:probable DNA replication complex GINS protein PSF3 [Coffea arabica]
MANYYDIDDVLAEQEFLPVLFQQGAEGVGLFDSGDDANEVEAGAKVELPFCLARDLHVRGVVAIDVPPYFRKVSRTRKEIEADAAHVDLRSRCQYFYELGLKIAPLAGDKSIGPFLLVAFQTRYKEVLVKAHTAASAVASKHLTLLTNEEVKLCKAGQSSTAAFKK